ncbi:type VI secretion protein [Streptomyces sp. NPDC012888]|uniref:type VI secretion protein n=1 Tax=Streptomyces sp. NPDC012888 TaxID=3364855 RepID=UPI003692DD28
MPGATPQPRPAQRGVPDSLLVGLLAFLLGLAALVWSSTGLSAWLAHGTWPDTVTFGRTPEAVRSLIAQPHDMAAAWPETAPAALSGWGLFWGLFISQLLVLFVLTVFGIGVVARTKARRARARHAALTPDPVPVPDQHQEARPDPAPAAETAPAPQHAPAPATPAAPATPDRATAPLPSSDEPPVPVPSGYEPAAAYGSQPTEPARAAVPRPSDEAYRYGFGYAPTPAAPPARLAYAGPAERHHAAARRIREAEGAALVVTSSPTLWKETKDARAKLGPVLLYDPSHLCDSPARLHWNPAEDCADRDAAAARAVALLAPVRPQARIDAALADTAETLLRSWLHASALADRPFKQVHRWAQGTGAQEPVQILRTHPKAAPGSAGELESALTAHPERRELAQQLTARALSSLGSIHIRESCNGNRTDSLALASFLNEGGSLYLVGEPLEDPRAHPGAMPLLTALASSVVEHGRRMAARSSHGRLDPPLSLVLDDVAAVAPIPQLPDLLADTALPLLALCRSREQARSRWPEAEAALPSR